MNQPDSTSSTFNNDALRLFIGIACPHLDKVAELMEELRQVTVNSGADMRVVPESNLHITLKFLGSVRRSAIGQVAAALDRLAVDTKPFTITLAGAGAFKDALWLGVDPCDALTRLATRINQQLEPLGFPSEHRPLIPHLTLARLKRKTGAELQTWLKQQRRNSRDSVDVQEMHLYKSETLSSGARYSIVHTSAFRLSK